MEKISLMITLVYNDPAEPLPALLRGIFPCCELCTGPGSEVLILAPGVTLQLCGPAAHPPVYLANAGQPVISYAVSDLRKAIQLGIEQGAEILQEFTDDCTGFSCSYLKFPDGQPFGLFMA